MSSPEFESYRPSQDILSQPQNMGNPSLITIKDQLAAWLPNPDETLNPPYGPYTKSEMQAALDESRPQNLNNFGKLQEKRAGWLQRMIYPELLELLPAPQEQLSEESIGDVIIRRRGARHIKSNLIDKPDWPNANCRRYNVSSNDFHIDIENNTVPTDSEINSFVLNAGRICESCVVRQDCIDLARSISKPVSRHHILKPGSYVMYAGVLFPVPTRNIAESLS